MPARYARLKSNWMLRGWENLPHVVMNWMSGQQRSLDDLGFYVAESCDGKSDFNSFAYLSKHRDMLDWLIEQGIAEECRKGQSIEPWQRYRKAPNDRISGLHWGITGRCNLKCRHCHMQAPDARYGHPPFKKLASLIDQFERANVIQVSLTGGEPFLRKDLLKIIALLAERKIFLNRIFTNGLLIKDEHLAEIHKLGFLPAFQISFDGVGKHDQMRGVQRVESKTIDAIRRVRAAGFPVIVSTCVDQINVDSLPATYDLVRQLDAQSWIIGIPQRTGNWRNNTTEISLDDQARAFAPVLETWLKDQRPFRIQFGGFYCGQAMQMPCADGPDAAARQISGVPVRSAKAKRRAASPKPGTAIFTPESYDCGSCREFPCLLPDGTLLPCPGYVDSPFQARMPNLFCQDLSDAWRKSYLRELSEIRKKDILAHNPECAACKLFFTRCGGGCRAAGFTETGHLLSRDPITCELYQKGHKDRFRELAAAAER